MYWQLTEINSITRSYSIEILQLIGIYGAVPRDENVRVRLFLLVRMLANGSGLRLAALMCTTYITLNVACDDALQAAEQCHVCWIRSRDACVWLIFRVICLLRLDWFGPLMQSVYGLRYWRCHCDEFVFCDDDNPVIGAPTRAPTNQSSDDTRTRQSACHRHSSRWYLTLTIGDGYMCQSIINRI